MMDLNVSMNLGICFLRRDACSLQMRSESDDFGDLERNKKSHLNLDVFFGRIYLNHYDQLIRLSLNETIGF